MLIGVPKEVKEEEYRVGLTPDSVLELTQKGHSVFVQSQCGAGIGFQDNDYHHAGAEVLETAEQVFAAAEMIVKVKEPQPQEYHLLKPHHLLFTYLHLAPDLQQAKGLLASGCSAIAYETVINDQGQLPLLTPMSEVAGRLSIQAGAVALQKNNRGRGVLLGGVPGVSPAEVLIIGGGVVGENALMMALGMGANVTVMDRSLAKLNELDKRYFGRIKTVFSTSLAISEYSQKADMIVGAVLVAGAKAPKLLTEDDVAKMKPGAVLVDVAIDQGGCFATSQPTTHNEPTFIKHNVVHYCVANMPGSVPLTSSKALNHATLPYVMMLADGGLKAVKSHYGLLQGFTVHQGNIVHPAVADALGMAYVDPIEALQSV
ncbi:MAG: alanine dehydrogenase [Candidatus Comchoanobacterales bacterium]